jgi:nitrate/nitrite transport system ATP-binding protein
LAGGATTKVLKDINLSIEEGEYVLIIGHSGCGKSILHNIIAEPTGAPRGGVQLAGPWCSRTTACCLG